MHENMLDDLRSWQPDSFGPADYQSCHYWLTMLTTFKNLAQQHIRTEVDMIIKTYDAHVAFLLRRVKVIVATTDAANKLFANLVVGPAKSSRNTCDISIMIMDEAQRCDVLPAAALLANV